MENDTTSNIQVIVMSCDEDLLISYDTHHGKGFVRIPNLWSARGTDPYNRKMNGIIRPVLDDIMDKSGPLTVGLAMSFVDYCVGEETALITATMRVEGNTDFQTYFLSWIDDAYPTLAASLDHVHLALTGSLPDEEDGAPEIFRGVDVTFENGGEDVMTFWVNLALHHYAHFVLTDTHNCNDDCHEMMAPYSGAFNRYFENLKQDAKACFVPKTTTPKKPLSKAAKKKAAQKASKKARRNAR